MKDIETLYQICDELFKEFEGEIEDLTDRVHNSLCEKMKSNGIPCVEVTEVKLDNCEDVQTYYSDTMAKLLANDRILSLLKGHINVCFYLKQLDSNDFKLLK